MTSAAAERLEVYAPRGLTAAEVQVLRHVRGPLGFLYFLPHWTFVGRETGEVRRFDEVWEGQAEFARTVTRHRNVYELKAGKVGLTEIECAYDAWALMHQQKNARVHLFSQGLLESRSLLEKVKFGILHLPDYLRMPVLSEIADGNNSRSLKLWAGPDDVRTVVSYPAREEVSIDQTCTHAHLDEFARWPYGEAMWRAIRSTVSPEGSVHIITRGRGRNWAGKLYMAARAGSLFGPDGTPYRAGFLSWRTRPRPAGWREREAAGEADVYIWQYAPESWQEALQGDETYVYPMWESPPGRHLVPAHPCEPRDCKRLVITCDPGGTAPTALGLYGERSSGGRHKYAEWVGLAASTDQIEAQIVAWEQWCGRRVRVGVPKDEPTLYATLKAHGFLVFWVATDRDEGIRYVRQQLEANQYTVHASCVETAMEYDDYRVVSVTDATTKVVYAGERPVKHHCDTIDCDRYALMAFGQWVETEVVEDRQGRRLRVRR